MVHIAQTWVQRSKRHSLSSKQTCRWRVAFCQSDGQWLSLNSNLIRPKLKDLAAVSSRRPSIIESEWAGKFGTFRVPAIAFDDILLARTTLNWTRVEKSRHGMSILSSRYLGGQMVLWNGPSHQFRNMVNHRTNETLSIMSEIPGGDNLIGKKHGVS